MTNQHHAILSACAGPVALFLDFDGTLVEIAPRPDAIEIPDTLIARLTAVGEAVDGALALISGRAIADIDRYLRAPHLTISGSHGAEQRHSGVSHAPSGDTAQIAAQIAQTMKDRFADDPRIIVEPKPAGVAVHFRAASERDLDVLAAFGEVLLGHDDLVAISGKAVVEAKPRAITKGTAIMSLLNESPFRGRIPVFIGDDVTDEDGFRAVNAVGGVSIKIGQGTTLARFRLYDVADVLHLLDMLIAQQNTFRPSAPRKEASR